MWIAERDGDTAALGRLNAEQKQSMNEFMISLQATLSKLPPADAKAAAEADLVGSVMPVE